MPEIPTYTAQPGLASGPVAANADASTFGSGAQALGRLGNDLQNASRSAAGVSADFADIAARRKSEKDSVWKLEQVTKFNERYVGWQNENRNSETLAEDSKAFLGSLSEELAGDSPPSANAARDLRLHFRGDSTKKWSDALKDGEVNRKKNALLSISKAGRSIGEIHRAGGDIDSQYSYTIQAIDDGFKSDPAFAQTLKDSILEDAVVAVSAQSPELAKKLVDESNVDEEKRALLMRHIDGHQASLSGSAKYLFKKDVENAIRYAKDNGIPVNVSGEQIASVLGADTSEAAALATAVNDTNNAIAIWKPISEKVPAVQTAALEGIKQSDLSADTKDLVGSMLKASQDTFNRNASEWFKENDSDTKYAFDISRSNPDSPQLATSANALLLDKQKQGGLAIHQLKLLSDDDAKERGARLNGMGPVEKVKEIEKLESEFQDPLHLNTAWNDLVSIGKVNGATQLLGAIVDPRLRQELAAVIDSSKDIEKLSPERRVKFEAELSNTKEWRQMQALINPNVGPQNAKLAVEFRDLIVDYATRLAQPTKGAPLSVGAAVKKSMDDLINGSFGMVRDREGHMMLVHKARLYGKPPRTDSEIQNLAHSMSYAKMEFPVQEVEQTNLLGLPVFRAAGVFTDPSERLNEIQKVIRKNGWWRVNPSGQGATLHVWDEERNESFPLYDKKGNQFEVDYDEIPNAPLSGYINNPVAGMGGFGGINNQIKVSEPPKTAPFLEKSSPFSRGERAASETRDKKDVGFMDWLSSNEGVGYFLKDKTKINAPSIHSYYKNLRKPTVRDFKVD